MTSTATITEHVLEALAHTIRQEQNGDKEGGRRAPARNVWDCKYQKT